MRRAEPWCEGGLVHLFFVVLVRQRYEGFDEALRFVGHVGVGDVCRQRPLEIIAGDPKKHMHFHLLGHIASNVVQSTRRQKSPAVSGQQMGDSLSSSVDLCSRYLDTTVG